MIEAEDTIVAVAAVRCFWWADNRASFTITVGIKIRFSQNSLLRSQLVIKVRMSVSLHVTVILRRLLLLLLVYAELSPFRGIN